MPLTAHAPSPEALEFGRAWHDLTGAQAQLDRAAQEARNAVAVAPMLKEDSAAIVTRIEEAGENLLVHVTVPDAAPERVRAVATTNLLLVRATTRAGRVVEHLVRLPVSVTLDDWEAQFENGTFTISFAVQTSLPIVLWRPTE